MNVWVIIYRVSCAALAAMVIAAVVSVFLPKIREVEAKREKAAVMEEEIRVKADMTQDLKNRQERFRTDPAYVERVARDELGKAKPDEVIFRFPEPDTNASPGR